MYNTSFSSDAICSVRRRFSFRECKRSASALSNLCLRDATSAWNLDVSCRVFLSALSTAIFKADISCERCSRSLLPDSSSLCKLPLQTVATLTLQARSLIKFYSYLTDYNYFLELK